MADQMSVMEGYAKAFQTDREAMEEELRFFEGRAEAALRRGDMHAHLMWGRKYHAMKRLLGITD